MSSKTNSGNFIDIQDGVEHSKENAVLITHVSESLLYKDKFVMKEPTSLFKKYRAVLFADLKEMKLPEKFKYRPEALAEYLYETPDLFYLVYYANSITRPIELNGDTVKFFSPEAVNTYLKMIEKNKTRINATIKNPKNVKDRTIRDIRV
jgi:hypothetical protein